MDRAEFWIGIFTSVGFYFAFLHLIHGIYDPDNPKSLALYKLVNTAFGEYTSLAYRAISYFIGAVTLLAVLRCFLLFHSRSQDIGHNETVGIGIGGLLYIAAISSSIDEHSHVMEIFTIYTALFLAIGVTYFSLPSQPGPNRYGPNPLEVTP